MAVNKKLKKLVRATRIALEDDWKAKKLRKADAFSRFLAKLEARRVKVKRRLRSSGLSKKERESLEEQLEALEKGLKKGKKLRQELD